MQKQLFRALFIIQIVLLSTLSYSQVYVNKIENYSDFLNLKGKPTVTKYASMEAVKVVYDLKTKGVYFINSLHYKLHYYFCLKELKYRRTLDYFNYRNYSDKNRRFILVNINYFKEPKKYVLEFNVVDNIGTKNMILCYKAIKKQFIKNKKLYISLNNNSRLDKSKTFLKIKIPRINPNELFGFQKLQIINTGEENGELIVIKNKKELLTLHLKDKIVLLTIDVLEMPICKAIITTGFQTPLSHISILAQNRGIPVLAYPKAMQDSGLTSLIGKNICLSVTTNDYLTKLCNPKTITITTLKKRTLKANLKLKTLRSAKVIYLKNKKSYGSKVVNFCELRRVARKKYKTPEGAFGIPFYYYYQHVSKTKIKKKIDNLLENPALFENRELLDKKLKEIRKSIKKQSLNYKFLAKVLARIDTTKNGIRYRFRSSSNAEDIKGFNGAGLYTSKTGIVGDSSKTIEKAIKKVWASVWTLRAFEERQFFNLDQKSVYMGILVHRSFPNDIMNGVAITRNLYRNYGTGFVLNNQIGEHKVVDNEKGNTSEQLITYFNTTSKFYNQKDAVEYIATSNLNNFKPILTKKQIYELTKDLERIKKHFYYKFKGRNYKKFTLDIEYKIANDLEGKQKFYIKQVRLFSTKQPLLYSPSSH